MPSVPILELHLEVSVREDDKIYFLLTLKAQFMQTKVFREEEGGDVIKHLQQRQRRKEQMCSQNCTQNFVLVNPCAQSSLNVGTELILNKPQKTSCFCSLLRKWLNVCLLPFLSVITHGVMRAKGFTGQREAHTELGVCRKILKSIDFTF